MEEEEVISDPSAVAADLSEVLAVEVSVAVVPAVAGNPNLPEKSLSLIHRYIDTLHYYR